MSFVTELLVNGRVYAAAPDATAMAVVDGVIAWVGSDRQGRLLYPGASVVDVAGGFVAPAFVDAHVHVTSSGLVLAGLDLSGCRSLAECLSLLAGFVAVRPDAGVVWGHGWDETVWPEGRPPSRAEVDAAVGAVPVYLSRVDVHSALVSSALVGLVPAVVGVSGWSVDGPVSQAAHHHARGAARAALSAEQRRSAQRAFLGHAAAHGVAAVHECAGPDISGTDDLAELLALATAGGTPQVVGYWGERADPELAARLGVRGLAGDLFIDGAVGSRTAALREPYTDDPGNTGARYLSDEQIAQHLVACTRAGIQAGFHVIGDAGVAALVAGFTAAQSVVGRAALVARRHRVEHLEMVDAQQAALLGGWGVVGSVQPAFDAAWGGPDGMYARRLGGRRGVALNPFSVLAASGVRLAFGSDSPVTAVDPWGGVRAAVHHRTPGFGVSPRAAFTAHTRGGWRAAADDLSGVLAPGAPATYAVWQAGELDCADEGPGVPGLPSVAPDVELPVCVRTVLRGETIFDAEGR
ncbi:MAG TPA: amidohydrolase family protein [Pseudonocardiaceae bacterium]|nr:amidohydrolase family protein [Pseudonocardiaceae bacterium]